MQKELKCPKCGGARIVEDDCFETNYDIDAVIELYCGHCEDCGTDITWEAVYQFIGYDAIEES